MLRTPRAARRRSLPLVCVLALLLALVAVTAPQAAAADGRPYTNPLKFTWNADGTPDFGKPVALGGTRPGPSGETAATPASYALVNRNSGKCLDVTGGGADGTDVRQWSWLNNTCQQWRLVPTA